MSTELNLFYKPLEACNSDNYCSYFFSESGINIVCAEITEELYYFFKKRGYHLTKQNVDSNKCCICVYKWVEAYHAGVAPRVFGESTSVEMLKHVPMDIVKNYII